jgi:uncharacterized protein (TIGR00369 family)
MSAQRPVWHHARDAGEDLFALTPYVLEPDGALHATMPADTRLLGLAGTASPAGLGVLVDEVLGHLVNRAGAGWSVSTDLLVEVVGQVSTDGSELRCEARLLAQDERGATVTGRVTDAAGNLVAHALSRGRFTGAAPADLVPPDIDLGGPLDTRSLLQLLGPDVVIDAGGRSMVVQASPRFSNPLGNLHGGISFCLSGLLAEVAVPSPTRTAAIRINHVRPIPPGSDVTFTATVQHHGRSLAVVHVVAAGADGRACTVATVTRH